MPTLAENVKEKVKTSSFSAWLFLQILGRYSKVVSLFNFLVMVQVGTGLDFAFCQLSQLAL
jgi:hypothetical protein